MQWPCSAWYHVPTNAEWVAIITAWWWWTNWTNLSNTLKLSLAGYPLRNDGTMSNQGSYGYYCSSSPYGAYEYLLFFHSTNIYPSYTNGRSDGCSIRCIKN
jgi:hypothetical protein